MMHPTADTPRPGSPEKIPQGLKGRVDNFCRMYGQDLNRLCGLLTRLERAGDEVMSAPVYRQKIPLFEILNNLAVAMDPNGPGNISLTIDKNTIYRDGESLLALLKPPYYPVINWDEKNLKKDPNKDIKLEIKALLQYFIEEWEKRDYLQDLSQTIAQYNAGKSAAANGKPSAVSRDVPSAPRESWSDESRKPSADNPLQPLSAEAMRVDNGDVDSAVDRILKGRADPGDKSPG